MTILGGIGSWTSWVTHFTDGGAGALKDMIFGKRSERLVAIVAEQFALELDDLATGVTPPAPANDDAPATKPPASPRKKARRNIGALPKHLPRCEQVLEPDTTACPCCAGRLHKIGEDVSEVLDVIPAILGVLRTIRPKYACRADLFRQATRCSPESKKPALRLADQSTLIGLLRAFSNFTGDLPADVRRLRPSSRLIFLAPCAMNASGEPTMKSKIAKLLGSASEFSAVVRGS